MELEKVDLKHLRVSKLFRLERNKRKAVSRSVIPQNKYIKNTNSTVDDSVKTIGAFKDTQTQFMCR